MKAKWLKVDSSQIAKMKYLQPISTLLIEFNAGGKYQYTPVPEHIYRELKTSVSKGKTFNQLIKKNPFIIFKRTTDEQIKELEQESEKELRRELSEEEDREDS